MGLREKESLIQQKPEIVALPKDNSEKVEHKSEEKSTEETNLFTNDQDVDKKKSLWSETTARQKLLLLYLLLIDFLTLFCVSTPSSFFARIMAKRGGTLEHSVVILRSVSLSMSISSVIFGKYQPYIGCKTLLFVGVGTFGLSQVAFGFLVYIEEVKILVAVGVILRVLQGVGEGAIGVSCLSLLCQEYPKHISTVFGISEAAVGSGYLVGPVFGGALFDAYGMLLPLVLSGGVMLILLPLGIPLMRKYTASEYEESFDVCKWIFNPKVVIILLCIATIYGSFGFCDVAITNYLEELDFSATHSGLVLFDMGLSYSIASVLCGWVVGSRDKIRKISMAVGFIGFTGMMLVYAPHQSTVVIYVASSASGIFLAISTIPSFEELLIVSSTGQNYDSTNFVFVSAISGAWQTAIGLAMFLLPLIGPALQNATGSFSWSLFTLCCIGFVASSLLSTTVFAFKRLKK